MNPSFFESSFFEYRTEPIRSAAIATFVLVLFAVLMPFLLFQLMILCVAAGPAAWTLTQLLRRGRGVHVAADRLVVQSVITGRTLHIPYARMIGCTRRGSNLIAGWLAEPREPPPKPAGPPARTDRRPETHVYPHRSLFETPPLANADGCLVALAQRLEGSPRVESAFSADDLLAWANRRRRRDTLLLILGVLGTPLYVIFIGHVLGLFTGLRGN
jgi:hypothetical protein